MSKPVVMWAAIVKFKRSEWIETETIRATKRACQAEYKDGWCGADSDWLMSRVRFARVEIREIT